MSTHRPNASTSSYNHAKARNQLDIHYDEPLKNKNWFVTGGPARYFGEPDTQEQFAAMLRWAAQQKLTLFVLGQGANILISDDGFNGFVVRPKLKNIALETIAKEETLVTAGAGVLMQDLIDATLDHNLGGLETFSGIPGTIGGAVFINLHYCEFLLSQFVAHATVIHHRTGKIKHVSRTWFSFGYNMSTLHKQDYFLIDATFKLKKLTNIETAYTRGRCYEIIRHRIRRYPASHTCGSFFRNFFPEELIKEKIGKNIPHVAYYLDKLGMKGELSVGDAIVSHQHANMIVNKGKATSRDIIALARKMQDHVFKAFGLTPQPECRLVGFDQYPLRPYKGN